MSLRTQVLASQINNLSDARYFSAYPVDWMSFIGNPNASNYIPVDQINEIIGWIAGPKILMDARGCSIQQMQEFVDQVKVSGLIVDATQSISSEIEEHYDCLRVIYLPAELDLSIVESELHQVASTKFLILDFQMNSAPIDVIFNPAFPSLITNNKVIIDAEIPIKDISRLIESNVNGLVISSGDEEKVGLRSFEDIQDLMEELEVED